jgi:hypothetical protein
MHEYLTSLKYNKRLHDVHVPEQRWHNFLVLSFVVHYNPLNIEGLFCLYMFIFLVPFT